MVTLKKKENFLLVTDKNREEMDRENERVLYTSTLFPPSLGFSFHVSEFWSPHPDYPRYGRVREGGTYRDVAGGVNNSFFNYLTFRTVCPRSGKVTD